MIFFIKGFIIGISIASIIGPIGLLCINNSLKHGFKAGLLTGLGAATADAVYGFVAAFGLTAISNFLLMSKFWIQILGGGFLICLGIKLILDAKKQPKFIKAIRPSSLHSYGTTFVLTLTNPMTILSFMAVFAGIGIGTVGQNYLQAALVVLGVFMGSCAWWLFLSSLVSFVLHDKISNRGVFFINLSSAAIILIFGAISMWESFG